MEELPMKDFFEALTSERKNTALPDEFNYFGKLIGSWAINYIESNNSLAMKGELAFLHGSLKEWLFKMLLFCLIMNMEHRCVSIILTHTHGCAYGYTGKIIRLEAKNKMT